MSMGALGKKTQDHDNVPLSHDLKTNLHSEIDVLPRVTVSQREDHSGLSTALKARRHVKARPTISSASTNS